MIGFVAAEVEDTRNIIFQPYHLRFRLSKHLILPKRKVQVGQILFDSATLFDPDDRTEESAISTTHIY